MGDQNLGGRSRQEYLAGEVQRLTRQVEELLSACKITARTRPVGAVDEPQSDYYPGTWWHSLSAAIGGCLPDQRATARGGGGGRADRLPDGDNLPIGGEP